MKKQCCISKFFIPKQINTIKYNAILTKAMNINAFKNYVSQENFKCIKCNNELNADYNSSINIRNRILTDVLRDKLLVFTEHEWNCNTRLKHSTVTNILLEYFDS